MVGGELVGLQVSHHLEAVLQPAQEAVGVGQDVGVRAPDEPLLGQDGQRPQGVGLAEARVTAAVDQLEQLDRELHVPDAAAPPLQLHRLLAHRPYVLLDASLRGIKFATSAGLIRLD